MDLNNSFIVLNGMLKGMLGFQGNQAPSVNSGGPVAPFSPAQSYSTSGFYGRLTNSPFPRQPPSQSLISRAISAISAQIRLYIYRVCVVHAWVLCDYKQKLA